MKIAIDIQSLASSTPSGVGHYVLETLTHLQPPPNAELVLFSRGWRKPSLPEPLTKAPFRHVHRRAPNKLVNGLTALGLVSLERLLGEQVDTVWFPDTGYLPYTQARTILTVHDLAWYLMPETYTWLQRLRYRLIHARKQIRGAHTIVTVSPSTRRDVLREFNRYPDQVHVIPPGVDRSVFQPRPTPQDATRRQQLGITRPYLLVLATKEPRKNHLSVLEAFQDLQATGTHVDLVLAGGSGWKSKQIKRALKRHPNRDHIHDLGYIPDDLRPILLRGARALVLPSRYEGFGMQLAEAMACGTPVITSRNSSLPEVGSDAALTVRAMHVNELTRVLQELLRSSKLQQELAKRGVARSQQISWKASAKHLAQLLVS